MMNSFFANRFRSNISSILLIGILITILPVSLAFSQSGKKGKQPQKEICITFDELPASQGFNEVDLEAITYLILEALRKHDVKSAGFVVGANVESAYDALGKWLNDGHVLGTMTYSNQDLNGIGIEQFINDIKMGNEQLEPMLSGFGQKKRYFRYPFLHYGSTVKAHQEVRDYLEHIDMTVAHATVVPEDYIYNFSLEKLGKTPDSARFEALLNEYINSVLDELERVELVAQQVVGRNVRQILLLRANRLNAVFIDEMLTALEDMGYKFVSLDDALKDEVYSMSEAYYGSTGIGYLDMIQQSNPDLLPAE